MTIAGAVDTLALDAYRARSSRVHSRGDIVVLDNPDVHKASRIEQVARDRGASVLWLPPYSPSHHRRRRARLVHALCGYAVVHT